MEITLKHICPHAPANSLPGPPTSVVSPTFKGPQYNGTLLKKYKYDNGRYHSTTTGSMFENMISYIPWGLMKALEVWNSEQFCEVRQIDAKINQNYRKNYSGGGSYTFHSLTYDEIKTFDKCLNKWLFDNSN